jgi:hypothetical protein
MWLPNKFHLDSGAQVRSQIALGAISDIPSPPKLPVSICTFIIILQRPTHKLVDLAALIVTAVGPS